MNKISSKYFFSIIFFVVFFSFTTHLYSFASTPLKDEIEKSVFCEKKESSIYSYNFNKPEQDKPKDEIKKVYAPANYYDFLPKTNNYNLEKQLYQRKIVKKKTYNLFNNKLFEKLNQISHKYHLDNKLLTQIIKNELKKINSYFNNINKITTIDFVPYYFLTPSIPENYVKNSYFPNEIKNINELLPYSLTITKNTIYKIKLPKNVVTPYGTSYLPVLINAPSPQIEVLGKKVFAKLVIDIGNNTLYKYNENGLPLKAYLVATGSTFSGETRTRAGLRIVTYKERFPYAGDPTSKRAQDPYSYGPYIIFLNVFNPKTGRQFSAEQLLHGNGSEYSIGKKVSHGCVRTNNSVMKYELSKEVKRGDFILLINPD